MNISLDLLESQHLIGRLKLIELLERQSKFRNSKEHVERRFSQALKSLPPDFSQPALAIFGSILYITEQMLDNAWIFLFSELKRKIQPFPELDDIIILELDRDVLRDDFYRANSLVGRLQDNLPWRSSSDIIDVFMQLEGGQIAPELTESFSRFLKRRLWILLIDLSISGTSAMSEISRLHQIHSIFSKKRNVNIVALIQVATEEVVRLLDSSDYDYVCAIKIPKYCALNDPTYNLISDHSVINEMKELCKWFAENIVLSTEYRIAKLSKEQNDPDIAAFGFGKKGWNIVTYKNTPNNSLPLLWFRPPNNSYLPPFERIDSRIGASWPGRKEWLKRVTGNKKLKKHIIEILSKKL